MLKQRWEQVPERARPELSRLAPPWAFVALEIAKIARGAWEPLWAEWKLIHLESPKTHTDSADTALATSMALRQALSTALPHVVWRVVGGHSESRRNPAGYSDGNAWHPHLWVVGRADRAEVLLDITSDQFGGPEVVVTDAALDYYLPNITDKNIADFEYHERENTEFFLQAFADAAAN